MRVGEAFVQKSLPRPQGSQSLPARQRKGENMPLTMALVGNPNSGKTTLFNQLTGNHQYVGNWPGVTVERKTGTLKDDRDAQVVDLPGIYSLSPYSNEEVIARDYLIKREANVIVDIVDASNLERNLYLTTQLMEFGTPVVVALNQMDIVRKRGYEIDSAALSQALGLPVVEISRAGIAGTAPAGRPAGQRRAAPGALLRHQVPGGRRARDRRAGRDRGPRAARARRGGPLW